MFDASYAGYVAGVYHVEQYDPHFEFRSGRPKPYRALPAFTHVGAFASASIADALRHPYGAAGVTSAQAYEQALYDAAWSNAAYLVAHQGIWVSNPTEERQRQLITIANEFKFVAQWRELPDPADVTARRYAERFLQPAGPWPTHRLIVLGKFTIFPDFWAATGYPDVLTEPGAVVPGDL
jgi:hypothetical protein